MKTDFSSDTFEVMYFAYILFKTWISWHCLR